MIYEFTLSEEDRERFGGPEWVPLDQTRLGQDYDYDRLNPLERQMFEADKLTIAVLLIHEWPNFTMLGIRGMHWLARQLSGVTEPRWRDFRPNIIESTYRVAQGDAHPPAQGSSEPQSAKRTRSKKDSTS